MTDTTDAAVSEQTDVVLADAMAFNEARLMVERAQKSVRQQSVKANADEFRFGKLDEALDVAGKALFNALNTASSYCHCPAAHAAIQHWFAEHAAPEEVA